MRRKSVYSGALVATLAAVAVTVPMSITSVASAASPAAKTVRSPIKHVVQIMLENHTFDDLFGHFPGADGIPLPVRLC